MRGLVQILPGAGLAACAAAASAQPSVPAPAGRWLVDWGANQCSLGRERGGATTAGIAVQLVPGTESVDITVVDSGWKASPVRSGGTVSIRLDAGEPVEARARRIQGKGRFGFVATGIDRSFLERYAKARHIAVLEGGKPRAAMALPDAGRAVEALAACERDILAEWKADTAPLAELQRRVRIKKNAALYVTDGDFPEDALSKGEQGTSVVRVTVEPDGKPSACGVVSSSGSRTLDLQTCAILVRRAQYEPALDAAGRPVRSILMTRLTWRIEGR